MNELVKRDRRGSVAVITVDNPPVNALSPGVPRESWTRWPRPRGDPAVQAIVVIGGGRTFIAGADIKELEAAPPGAGRRTRSQPSAARDRGCRKPVVMAIHGTALGGGMELAMAGALSRCDVADALCGQPEVNLGIIPGARRDAAAAATGGRRRGRSNCASRASRSRRRRR